MLDGLGAVVMGRKSFDKNEGDGGWGNGGPAGDTPCFVVTHNTPATRERTQARITPAATHIGFRVIR